MRGTGDGSPHGGDRNHGAAGDAWGVCDFGDADYELPVVANSLFLGEFGAFYWSFARATRDPFF